MFAPHLRGRRRALDQQKKVELCDLVHHGATVEEAADTIGVSLRTVQREAKFDEDFDHELKLALGGAPDPLKLMQRAARAHWRAAAWLLERTDPEHYGRRPKSSASPEQFEGALRFMLEAALEGTPPAARTALYQRLQAAREQAFASVFPNYGPWGKPKNPQLPPTPLANEERLNLIRDPASRFHVYGKVDDPVDAPAPLQPRALPGGRPPSQADAPPRPEVGWVDRAAATHQASTDRWDPAPRRTDPTTSSSDAPQPTSAPSIESCPPAESKTPDPPSAPAGRRHVARGASPWTKRRKKSKPQRGEVAPALNNRRPARPVKPRRPNVSRGNNRFLSPKTRFATKLNLAHLNGATAAPVSRDAAAVFDRSAEGSRRSPEAQT
jgi:hypothetical protein